MSTDTQDPQAGNSFTVLRMVGIGVPPYSARGLKQTLAHIDQASQLRRDVNGNLADISFSGFRKYKSTISGQDQFPPNFDGMWPGRVVTVDCISELSYTTELGNPARTVVPGSDIVDGLHTRYRPRLNMRVLAYSTDQDEYGADVSWTMDLEEV